MGIASGLSQLNKLIDSQGSKQERTKARWLRLKDGETAKIWFLQELDVDAENYEEDKGLAFVAVEHSHPENFRIHALCTIEDEGNCYGCEQNQANPRSGWRPRGRFYANVLVDEGDGKPYVAVLAQGLSGKAITPTLVMYASDAGTITGNAFRIKRSGSGFNDTEYTLIPIPKSDAADTTGLELFDLKNMVTKYIPYSEQEAFYAAADGEDSDAPKPAEKKQADNNYSVEW